MTDVRRKSVRAPSASRQAAFRLGLSAEARAVMLLRLTGHHVIARRFRSRMGEVDIVARQIALRGPGALVFVEVKARASFDEAVFAVTPHQQRRIVRGAQDWIMRHPRDSHRPIRFDVIAVTPGRWPRHLRAAFDAG